MNAREIIIRAKHDLDRRKITFGEFLDAMKPWEDAVPVVHGRWFKIHWKAFRCSECCKVSEYSTDYCPNCGAKMDGKDETDGTD